MEQLIERLNKVEDSYFDFVSGIVHYAKKKPERLQKLLDFLDEHPEALSSDVIVFVSNQPDFFEDTAYVKVS